MKTLLIIICLTCFKAMAFSQWFYGGSIGVISSNYYNTRSKEIHKGVNDVYLCVPIGYKTKYLLGEISPQGTASLIPSISAMVGGKLDFGDNVGIHILVGYKDQMDIQKHWKIDSYLFPTARVRIWTGNFLMQGTFIKKPQNSELELGIGVIGLWERIN